MIKVDATASLLTQSRRKLRAHPAGTAYAPGTWEWLKNLGDQVNGWEKYPEDINGRLEKAWVEGESSCPAGPGYHVQLDGSMKQIRTVRHN